MKTPRSLVLPLAALLLLALTLAACGSSGDSTDKGKGPSTPASAELSKAQLIVRADGICREVGQKVRSFPKPKTLAGVRQYSTNAALVSAAGVDRLRTLTPPASAKSDYEAFIKLADSLTAHAGDAAKATKAQDAAKLRKSIVNLLRQGAQTTRLAQKLGFKVCGLSAVTGAVGSTAPAPAP